MSNLFKLRSFVADAVRIIEDEQSEALVLTRLGPKLKQLVREDNWLPKAYAAASGKAYQQHLLYADPLDRLSIVSFVWGPGQGTPIYDHRVWGLVGVLRGEEVSVAYERRRDGSLKSWPTCSTGARGGRGGLAAHRRHPCDFQWAPRRLVDQHSRVRWQYRHDKKFVLRRADRSREGVRVGLFKHRHPKSLDGKQRRPDIVNLTSPIELRRRWRAGEEIALLDVREEGPYSLRIRSSPYPCRCRRSNCVSSTCSRASARRSSSTTMAKASPNAPRGASRRSAIRTCRILEGGLAAYAQVGELFRDVNVPSKAFGELVEAIRHTPSLSADEVKALSNTSADVWCSTRAGSTNTGRMSIPRGVSVPGGELAFRARDLAPSPETTIIVNCAGRTRSIIGAQSLINAGCRTGCSRCATARSAGRSPVFALERGQAGASQRSPRRRCPSGAAACEALADARRRRRSSIGERFERLRDERERTLYLLRRAHAGRIRGGPSAGFRLGAGRATGAGDRRMVARARRAIVLVDDDGVRAHMTASWLAQMGWETAVARAGAVRRRMSPRLAVGPASPRAGDSS